MVGRGDVPRGTGRDGGGYVGREEARVVAEKSETRGSEGEKGERYRVCAVGR